MSSPIFTRDTLKDAPSWVDVDDYELVYLDFRLEDHGVRKFAPRFAKEHLVCLSGEVAVEWAGGRVTLKKKEWVDISGFEATVTTARTTAMTAPSEVLWMAGHWPHTHYISVFNFGPGRPLETHHHDNDEYWFVARGRFEGFYNGRPYQFGPGDLLATGMGNEHGIPPPAEIIEGVGYTPRLEGRGRFGHLHRDTDGDPVPVRGVEEER